MEWTFITKQVPACLTQEWSPGLFNRFIQHVQSKQCELHINTVYMYVPAKSHKMILHSFDMVKLLSVYWVCCLFDLLQVTFHRYYSVHHCQNQPRFDILKKNWKTARCTSTLILARAKSTVSFYVSGWLTSVLLRVSINRSVPSVHVAIDPSLPVFPLSCIYN